MDDRLQSTSTLAGRQAALNSGPMRARILNRLRASPAALWEVARDLEVPDHIISGRFSELARDGFIQRTDRRIIKPESGCLADVWRIAMDENGAGKINLADRMNYPLVLSIEAELWDRQELLPAEAYPGIPYARRADRGGVRLNYRIDIIECQGCGKPLKLVMDGQQKTFRCGTPDCNRTWHCVIIAEPAKPPMLALVMKTM
jgi:hypothetical protein